MDDFRSLTVEEIDVLECNGCRAENWADISVAEDFSPQYIRQVDFYGEVCLGVFDKQLEVADGFQRHTGIVRAVLRNVSVGDNCLIENIGNYISDYTIGEECYISNVGTMATTDGAMYGQDNVVSVLNEAGSGNVIVYDGLTSQMAAFMMRCAGDRDAWMQIRKMVTAYVEQRQPERGMVGYRVKITNTDELINVVAGDDSEICGATRLVDVTLVSSPEASVYIGHDVICENTVALAGASILDGAKVDNSFVDEACHVGRGFSAENCLMFANSYLDNGEACAAFCGPFTVSHHKATLLIGGRYSFYNAGSATNFSNHAYKLGPIHYGELQRGSKTASGAHLLMPATIGAFSMCMGKIQTHPDTSRLPFSYVIGEGRETRVVPARNFTTVGVFRDVEKWPKRDKRPQDARHSIVNMDWLNPYVMQEVIAGYEWLRTLAVQGDDAEIVSEGLRIKRKHVLEGIRIYEMAIEMCLGEALMGHEGELPEQTLGTGKWDDLAGLLVPEDVVAQIKGELLDGDIETPQEIDDRLINAHEHYATYKWAWAYRTLLGYYGFDSLTEQDVDVVRQRGEKARMAWKQLVAKDADKEFELGDVDEALLDDFHCKLGL